MHKMIERGKTMLPVNLSSLRWNLQKKKNNINRRLRREKCWWDRSRVKKNEAASEARLGDVRLQINAQLLQRIIFKHVHCRCKAVRMKTPSASSRLSPIFILQTYEDYFFLRFVFMTTWVLLAKYSLMSHRIINLIDQMIILVDHSTILVHLTNSGVWDGLKPFPGVIGGHQGQVAGLANSQIIHNSHPGSI